MSKNIVVCCDGTGNQYCEKNTNVVKLFELLDHCSTDQVGFYDPGVGTLGSRIWHTRFVRFLSRLGGLAFAHGLTKNIEDAYQYLMDTYEDGDKLFLFGFSRGAYTARALAGMLGKCGLLHRGSNNLVPYATKLYRDASKRRRKRQADSEELKGFRDAFSRDCVPHLVGVWDTVKSVGFFNRITFGDSHLNQHINFGLHALSIDEKRWKFPPLLWKPHHDKKAIEQASGQSIKQVWFAGVHCDVGGSYKEAGLSNISLHWMIENAIQAGLKIDVKKMSAKQLDLKTDHTDELHNPLIPFWWLLGWCRRKISNGSMLHQSVFDRIQDIADYQPKNLPDKEKLQVTE